VNCLDINGTCTEVIKLANDCFCRGGSQGQRVHETRQTRKGSQGFQCAHPLAVAKSDLTVAQEFIRQQFAATKSRTSASSPLTYLEVWTSLSENRRKQAQLNVQNVRVHVVSHDCSRACPRCPLCLVQKFPCSAAYADKYLHMRHDAGRRIFKDDDKEQHGSGKRKRQRSSDKGSHKKASRGKKAKTSGSSSALAKSTSSSAAESAASALSLTASDDAQSRAIMFVTCSLPN
jgi:hypothetical protein